MLWAAGSTEAVWPIRATGITSPKYLGGQETVFWSSSVDCTSTTAAVLRSSGCSLTWRSIRPFLSTTLATAYAWSFSVSSQGMGGMSWNKEACHTVPFQPRFVSVWVLYLETRELWMKRRKNCELTPGRNCLLVTACKWADCPLQSRHCKQWQSQLQVILVINAPTLLGSPFGTWSYVFNFFKLGTDLEYINVLLCSG